jgi:hypothetical protein
VTIDSLPVYAEMGKSARVVQSLKRGDQVFLDFEFQTNEHWCSIRLLSQSTRLGYVPCQGLQRIEAHPSAASATAAGGNAGASKTNGLVLSSPPVRPGNGIDQIAALIVHDGAIDAHKMSEFDAAARTESSAAMLRAAAAHFAAAIFEISRNSVDEAIEQFQESLKFSDYNKDLQLANLLMLSYVDLAQSEYSNAIKYLDRAHLLEPRSVAVARLSGWAHYGLNQIDVAIQEWQNAQQIQPSPEVARALARAERDKAAESEAREAESSHFTLRYQGGATPGLAAEILSTLEEHFRSLASELHFTPPDPIGVVLYTQQSFRDTIDAPVWAVAGNDGRIRVPVEGLASVSALLSRTLKHELAHSFVWQKTRGRCPVWLDEGLAQWFEGRRSNADAAALAALYDRGQYIPLQRLEGGWNTMSGDQARFAYAWSLAAVEYIVATGGTWGIDRLFDHFDQDSSFAAALRAALQTDYADLERQTATYLRETYGH